MMSGRLIFKLDAGYKFLLSDSFLSREKVVEQRLWAMYCTFLAEEDLMAKSWMICVPSNSEVNESFAHAYSLVSCDALIPK